MNFLKILDTVVQKVLYVLTIALFVVLALILTANVGLRLINDLTLFLSRHGFTDIAASISALFPTSLHWFDEIVELCFSGLVFYGAAALWAAKGHFSVGDWISSLLPGHVSRALYKTCVTVGSLSFMAVFFWFSLRLTLRATELSTVFQIPKSVLYSCMPIASFIMLLYSLAELCQDVKAIGNKS